ncbi:MAG: class I SAM-dependent methyltransferase [Bryobacterales bacterium]|nr:class I SAM-dependent methyltransferase [Bryobacterales bacterium]
MTNEVVRQIRRRRWIRNGLLWGIGAFGVVALGGVAAYLLVRAAETGTFGPGTQHWVRAQKSRFVFNRLYGLPEAPVSQEPNAFLVQAVEGLHPGRALDIASGAGRNSVYLASRNWQVTAFDVSETGLEVTRVAAAARNLSIDLVEKSYHDFDYGHEKWDLVVLVYVSLPYDDIALLHRISDSIRPGGHLLIETPLMMHQAPNLRPRIPGDLAKGELPSLWPNLEPVVYREADEVTDFFHLHVPVAHFLARKAAHEQTSDAR